MTDHPGPMVVSLVKQFYANAKNIANSVVQVRGKLVSYDRITINSYFNLPTMRDNSYLKWGMFHYDLDYVIQRLCKSRTTWTLKQNTTEKVSFPHTTLSRYGKAWYSFLCANLMPTRHQNNVTKEQAILLFVIVTNLLVDVGLIMNESIARFLHESTMGELPHASLITGLCRQAQVQWSANELVQPPITIIDHGIIQRYKVWEGGISHQEGRDSLWCCHLRIWLMIRQICLSSLLPLLQTFLLHFKICIARWIAKTAKSTSKTEKLMWWLKWWIHDAVQYAVYLHLISDIFFCWI